MLPVANFSTKFREEGDLPLCTSGADLGGGCRGVRTPPPAEMTCGFLIQLVFCKKKKTTWFIGIEVEQETSAPPPKKNPGSAPVPLPSRRDWKEKHYLYQGAHTRNSHSNNRIKIKISKSFFFSFENIFRLTKFADHSALIFLRAGICYVIKQRRENVITWKIIRGGFNQSAAATSLGFEWHRLLFL